MVIPPLHTYDVFESTATDQDPAFSVEEFQRGESSKLEVAGNFQGENCSKIWQSGNLSEFVRQARIRRGAPKSANALFAIKKNKKKMRPLSLPSRSHKIKH